MKYLGSEGDFLFLIFFEVFLGSGDGVRTCTEFSESDLKNKIKKLVEHYFNT